MVRKLYTGSKVFSQDEYIFYLKIIQKHEATLEKMSSLNFEDKSEYLYTYKERLDTIKAGFESKWDHFFDQISDISRENRNFEAVFAGVP